MTSLAAHKLVHEASARDDEREGAQAEKEKSGVSQLLQTKYLRLNSAYRKSESANLCACTQP